MSTIDSKFIFAAEHGNLDDVMEMIDTIQDVGLLNNALELASNMATNLERLDDRIEMTCNIMYGVVSSEELTREADEYRVYKQDDYLQIVKTLLNYGANLSHLHETATQEMKEYIPVNPRKVLLQIE